MGHAINGNYSYIILEYVEGLNQDDTILNAHAVAHDDNLFV